MNDSPPANTSASVQAENEHATWEHLPPHLRGSVHQPTLADMQAQQAVFEAPADSASTPAVQGLAWETLAQELQQRFHSGVASHLIELRQRLIAVASIFALGLGFGVWKAPSLIAFLKRFAPPQTEFVLLAPTDGAVITLNIACLAGGVLAAPVALWHGLRFLAPGLQPNEKRWLLLGLSVGMVLFLAGLAVASTVLLPLTLKLLMQWNSPLGQTQLTLQSYLGFCFSFMLGISLTACSPLLVWVLGVLNLLTATQWLKAWREILLVSVVFAAVVSPTQDAFSLVMLSLLLFALYGVSWLGLKIITHLK